MDAGALLSHFTLTSNISGSWLKTCHGEIKHNKKRNLYFITKELTLATWAVVAVCDPKVAGSLPGQDVEVSLSGSVFLLPRTSQK